jgi:hypothetical protein
VLTVVLMLWALFGTWSLFRSDPGVGESLDPVIGHVVVFFFVSLAGFGLITPRLGTGRGLAVGVAVAGSAAAVSEWLQPILTNTRRAQLSDLFGNGVGIAAAAAVAVLLITAVTEISRRTWWTVGLCLIGLLGAGGVTALGFAEVRIVLECDGRGYGPIPLTEGSPIIHFDGNDVRLGDAPPQPVGNGLIAEDSIDLRCSVLRSGEFTIVVTVIPSSAGSEGPTRIFTSSTGTEFTDFNAHVGQERDALSVRIRTGAARQWETIPGVFDSGERVTVAVTVADGRTDVFVDGSSRATFALRGAGLETWDETFPILIGDEFTRDRPFEGVIERVSVFDRALTEGDPLLG